MNVHSHLFPPQECAKAAGFGVLSPGVSMDRLIPTGAFANARRLRLARRDRGVDRDPIFLGALRTPDAARQSFSAPRGSHELSIR
jgi:hypothetical protein